MVIKPKKISPLHLATSLMIKIFLLPLPSSMIHNIKEDEKIINENKTHMMPLAKVINHVATLL
jgi:hypothetical protein